MCYLYFANEEVKLDMQSNLTCPRSHSYQALELGLETSPVRVQNPVPTVLHYHLCMYMHTHTHVPTSVQPFI